MRLSEHTIRRLSADVRRDLFYYMPRPEVRGMSLSDLIQHLALFHREDLARRIENELVTDEKKRRQL